MRFEIQKCLERQHVRDLFQPLKRLTPVATCGRTIRLSPHASKVTGLNQLPTQAPPSTEHLLLISNQRVWLLMTAHHFDRSSGTFHFPRTLQRHKTRILRSKLAKFPVNHQKASDSEQGFNDSQISPLIYNETRSEQGSICLRSRSRHFTQPEKECPRVDVISSCLHLSTSVSFAPHDGCATIARACKQFS